MKELKSQYRKILADYIESESERNLYIGQNFIRQLIQKNVTPEEVVLIHKEAMEETFPELPVVGRRGYNFLIELMVYYGLALKEHEILLEKQQELHMEMDVAAKIQKMLLKTSLPQTRDVDIGMLSVPFRKMNGDYVYFLTEGDRYIGVAVTDVVGKGVPAALCMSIVKYGLDTLGDKEHDPSYVLQVLNRIIEKSVDDSMFVSMFYARYDLESHEFTYSSAGHEPALYYDAKEEAFYELEAKGLLLGIMPEMTYGQTSIVLNEGDFIVMMTDGVTEFRYDASVDSRNIITEFTFAHRHLGAQQLCEKLYDHMCQLQEEGLKDDFTVVIFKK